MKIFKEFWFEGNLYFNYVKSTNDLKRLFSNYFGQMNIDEILDNSHSQIVHDDLPTSKEPSYGFGRGYNSEKSLREYLKELGLNVIMCDNMSINEYIDMLEFPEHYKLSKVSKVSQEIGSFMDWLDNDKQYHLAQFNKEINEHRLSPVHFDINNLLAEYFDIDLKKLEKEKSEILNSLKN